MFRERFVDRAAADADAIEDHAAASRWPAVRDLAHGIVGRAGMFGFSELSVTARALEEAIDARLAPDNLDQLSRAFVSDLRGLGAGN